MLREQAINNPIWKGISFSRNFGHQTAVSAGIYHASGDVVVVMDADLQDPPEELHRFIAAWKQGYHVVYAIRTRRKEGPLKRLCYWGFYRLLAKMARTHIPLDSGDFCVMDRRVVDVLKSMPERNRFVRGLRAWTGFNQIGLPYERQRRVAGEAKYTLTKLIALAGDGLLSFSTIPLRLATYLGLWASGLAFLGIVFTLAQRLFRDFFVSMGIGSFPGFATIVISTLFLGGVQLVCIGILGEYLGRIYDEVKRRPQWVVAATAGIECRSPVS